MTNTDAATIASHLEELREVEPLLWEKITYLDQGDRVIKFAYQVLDDFALDHLQGCIQRAIAAIRKIFDIEMLDISLYEARVYDRANILGKATASTPAAAILAAYIEAKRARQ